MQQKISSTAMNRYEWIRCLGIYIVMTNLLILVGTFSEDMITTGISFSLDDSCMHTDLIQLQSQFQ